MKKAILSISVTSLVLLFVTTGIVNANSNQSEYRKTYTITSGPKKKVKKKSKEWEIIEDGNGTIHCPSDPGKCKRGVYNAMQSEDDFDEELYGEVMTEIDNYRNQTGTGTNLNYFLGNDWTYLFGEIGEGGYLEKLLNGEIHFYEVPCADKDAIAAFVLTPANRLSKITTSNILLAWEY